MMAGHQVVCFSNSQAGRYFTWAAAREEVFTVIAGGHAERPISAQRQQAGGLRAQRAAFMLAPPPMFTTFLFKAGHTCQIICASDFSRHFVTILLINEDYEWAHVYEAADGS